MRAQGYYQGAKQVWIPKAKPPTPPIETKPPQMKKDTIPCASTTVKPTWYWRQKQPRKSNATSEPDKTTKPKQTRMAWVPKREQPLINLLKETFSEVAQAHQPIVPTHANLGKKSRYPTIRERARALQIKLFGLRSLPTF